MSSGERPIGAAKGKQSDTEALCQPPPPPPLPLPDQKYGLCLVRCQRVAMIAVLIAKLAVTRIWSKTQPCDNSGEDELADCVGTSGLRCLGIGSCF